MANRLLSDFRRKAERLQGSSQRDWRFAEFCDQWLDFIRSTLEASSYERRVSSLNQTNPYFKVIAARLGHKDGGILVART
jgi:hypothetical protein